MLKKHNKIIISVLWVHSKLQQGIKNENKIILILIRFQNLQIPFRERI